MTAVPGDTRIKQKEQEKMEIYQELKGEIGRLWCLRKVNVIPVKVSALGCITKAAEKNIETVVIKFRTEVIQKTALMGTGRISRMVLKPTSSCSSLHSGRNFKEIFPGMETS